MNLIYYRDVLIIDKKNLPNNAQIIGSTILKQIKENENCDNRLLYISEIPSYDPSKKKLTSYTENRYYIVKKHYIGNVQGYIKIDDLTYI